MKDFEFSRTIDLAEDWPEDERREGNAIVIVELTEIGDDTYLASFAFGPSGDRWVKKYDVPPEEQLGQFNSLVQAICEWDTISLVELEELGYVKREG